MADTKDASPESDSEDSPSLTRQDLADSTREITERVDSQTEAVRSDLADRTEVVREQVVDSTQTAKSVLADKTEATRLDLAQRTEAVRVDLADRTDTIRQQVVDATQQAKTEIEQKTEATRASLEAKHDLRKVAVEHQFTSYRSWFVFAVIVFSLTNTLLYYLFLNPRAGQPVLVTSDVRVTGPTDLCPGQTLDFAFDVTVDEVGTYNLWMSTWKVDPPPSVIIFSETEPFVIGSKRNFPIARKWVVPQIYEDKADNEYKPFAPGSYFRDISITAEGRDTRNDPLQVKFTVRDDCQN